MKTTLTYFYNEKMVEKTTKYFESKEQVRKDFFDCIKYFCKNNFEILEIQNDFISVKKEKMIFHLKIN